MNNKWKTMALNGAPIILAVAMGLQTFIFGSDDIQTLKDEVAKLSERIVKLEKPSCHE